MSDYTPTVNEVREAVNEWVWSRRMWRPELTSPDGMEFDRWLDEDRRTIAAAAWGEGYQEANQDLWSDGGREGNPYGVALGLTAEQEGGNDEVD